MTRLARLIARFRSDERGMFAVMFGVIAIVLIATAGAVVDFVALQQARTRAQVALDAAALALQPEIFKPSVTEESIRQRAEALVRERLAGADVSADVYGISTNVEEGSLTLQARLEVPTAFVRLVGVNQLGAQMSAEATRKKLAVEVVMVLDNSGSMADFNRMTHLKQAANCATNILFYGVCTTVGGETLDDKVMIGVVPFTSLVNIGANNSNAAWLDRTGAAAITRQNFDNDDNSATPFNGPIDRIALFDQLTNVSWEGCVEARAYPHNVQDTPPNAANPETLFTPLFAPDEPDQGNYYNNYLSDRPGTCTVRTCTENQTRTCTTDNRGRVTCGSWSVNNYTRTVGNNVTTSNSSCRVSGGAQLSITNGPGSNPTTRQVVYSMLTPREMLERMCKYTGNVASFTGANSHLRGPNADCPDAAVLPLSTNPATVRSSITSMKSEGGTNIHQGAIWGFHVLSPSAPFTQGGPYHEATSKVMILMTDGENTFYTGSGYDGYSLNRALFLQAYGYPYNEREGNMSSTDSSMATRMNTLLGETCTNAKAEGIVIYTIGLSSPNNTTTNLLRNCATSPGHAHFPTTPSELTQVFTDIANQITQLRLAQ